MSSSTSSIVLHTRKQTFRPESNKLQIRLSNNGEPIKLQSDGEIVNVKAEEPQVEINNIKVTSPVEEEMFSSDSNAFTGEHHEEEGGETKDITEEEHERTYDNKLQGTFVTDGQGSHELHFEGALHFNDPDNPNFEKYSFHHVKNNEGITADFKHLYKDDTNWLVEAPKHDAEAAAAEEEARQPDLSLKNLNKIRVGLSHAVDNTPEDHSVAMNPKIIKSLIGFMRKIDQEHVTYSGEATESDYQAEKAKFEKIQKGNELQLKSLEEEIGGLNKEIHTLKEKDGRHDEEIEALENDEKKLSGEEAKTLLNYEKEKQAHIEFQMNEVEKDKHAQPVAKIQPENLVELDSEKADLLKEKAETVKPIENALKQNFEEKIEVLEDEIHETTDEHKIEELQDEKDKVELEEEQTIEEFEAMIDAELGDAITEFNEDIHLLTTHNADDHFIDRLEEITDQVKEQDELLKGELKSEDEKEYEELENEIHGGDTEHKANELVEGISQHSDEQDLPMKKVKHDVIPHLVNSIEALKGLYEFCYQHFPIRKHLIPDNTLVNTPKGLELYHNLKEVKKNMEFSVSKFEVDLNFLKRHIRAIGSKEEDMIDFFGLHEQYEKLQEGDAKLEEQERHKDTFFTKEEILLARRAKDFKIGIHQANENLDILLKEHEDNFILLDELDKEYPKELSESALETKHSQLAIDTAHKMIDVRDTLVHVLEVLEDIAKELLKEKDVMEEILENGLKYQRELGIWDENQEDERPDEELTEAELALRKSHEGKWAKIVSMASLVLVGALLF